MRHTDLSIIIVSFNTKELLKRCLKSVHESLRENDISVEIIVVDNSSTDGSVAMMRRFFPGIVVYTNEDNVGFGKANNQAIHKARGNIVLLLNSDITVEERAIDLLYRHFLLLPQKSILGGKLFNPNGTPQPSCGPQYSLINIFVALFMKGDYLNLTRYSPDRVCETDWVMGACMMCEREAFQEVGDFDEGIFMYMEEIDWEHRAKKKGYRVFFYPDAHFIHVGAGSSQGRANPILNVFQGLLYFYKKYHSREQLFFLKVLLVCKSIIAIALFAISGKTYDRKLYSNALKLVIENK